jgi:hypothetical protein
MTRDEEWVAPSGAHVVVAGSVFGLESEAEAVGRVLDTGVFEGVLLGISKEALESLAEPAPEVDEEELGPVTREYLKQLARFGATKVPAPDLYSAYSHAIKNGWRVEAIDLDDAAHTEAYVKHVGVLENIRKEKRQLRAAKEAAEVTGLDEFVTAWDRIFFATKGLRAVEQERERAMAHGIRTAVAQGRGRWLALVPRERLDGVLAALRAPPE